jgi:hypothetical protein
MLKGIPAKSIIPFNLWPGTVTNVPIGTDPKFSEYISMPAIPRRCAPRAAATSSPPAAVEVGDGKTQRAERQRCAPW